MAGAILLLVFGAQFLDWRWLALIAALTFPLAYFRTARRVPSPYRIAQVVDARLSLSDSISTALYFSEHETGSAAMRRAQLAEGEALGRQIDPRIAVPLRAPRTLYSFAALSMAAVVLFGVRYGVQHKMDLNRPLARILIEAFGGEGLEQRAAVNKRYPFDLFGESGADAPEAQSKEGDGPKGRESLEGADTPLQPGDKLSSSASEKIGEAKSKAEGSEASDGKPGDEAGESENKAATSAKQGDPAAGSKEGENPGGKQQPNAGQDTSLASKIKDAMSTLMSSLRNKSSNPNSQQGQSGGDPKSQQSKGGQKTQAQGQKKGGDEASDSDSEDGQQGDTEGGKRADNKGSSNQNSDSGSNGEKGSGAGKQEGSKNSRLAEQLAAMGKISEIIGKRSANVSGEVTIEVTSSKQTLRTPLTESQAAHAATAGEINRDEVPAAFQEYVQQYFEQIRRPAKAGKSTQNP